MHEILQSNSKSSSVIDVACGIGNFIMDTVKIGNNSFIGAGLIIIPGAILEDGVKLAAGAVVTKGEVLKKGMRYGRIPAKEIKRKKRNNS